MVLSLHVIALHLLAGDASVMGTARSGRWARAAGWVSIALVLACVAAFAWSWAGGF